MFLSDSIDSQASRLLPAHINSQHGAGELSAVANALNSRPRKTLGYRTSAEALDGLLKSDMIEGVAATDSICPIRE